MRARAVVVGGAIAAYVVLTHWLMTRAPASGWNAVVVVGPLLAAAAAAAWQRRQRLVAALAGLGAVALVLQAWRSGAGWSPNALYMAQHVAVHLLLAGMFALTLRPGREPLITALARRVHARLTADMVAYCRKATIAWSAYFLAMAALSLALFHWASFDAWAAFANLATPLALVLMFAGEYLLRYRLHPEFERVTIAAAMNAYAERRAPRPAVPHD